MEEQLVEQETLQLAKKLGFKDYDQDDVYPEHLYCAQSLLAKWLREVYNMFIQISMKKYIAQFDDGRTKVYPTYRYDIINTINAEIIKESDIKEETCVYEGALESGLKATLKLIEL